MSGRNANAHYREEFVIQQLILEFVYNCREKQFGCDTWQTEEYFPSMDELKTAGSTLNIHELNFVLEFCFSIYEVSL